MKKTAMAISCAIVVLLSGCNSKLPDSSSTASSVSNEIDSTISLNDNLTSNFEEDLYSKLKESNVLSSQSLKVNAYNSTEQNVYVILDNYNAKAFAEAVTLSTEFIKLNGEAYNLPSPKLSVVAGADSSSSATWLSEDLETGTWSDTSSLNIYGQFPLEALQGTYNPGSTDDKAVYVEQGGHWIVYHSRYNCPELEKETESFDSFPVSVAKSSLSERYKPCKEC